MDIACDDRLLSIYIPFQNSTLFNVIYPLSSAQESNLPEMPAFFAAFVIKMSCALYVIRMISMTMHQEHPRMRCHFVSPKG